MLHAKWLVFLTVIVVVQFYPWFKFCFPLLKTHYHTLPYPEKKEMKFEPRIKLIHNIFIEKRNDEIARNLSHPAQPLSDLSLER